MNIYGTWNYPTTIFFGINRLDELPKLCKNLKVLHPFLVTDNNILEIEYMQRLFTMFERIGLEISVFSGVDENPTEKHLYNGISSFLSKKHDCVIALGGGSVIDIGKLIAFAAHQAIDIWEFEDVGDNWTKASTEDIVPVIAIPTTAGTGSEVGRASVLTNSCSREKKIIFHPKILPTAVIADPILTVSMPKHVTAGTGMDAFAHCLEAFCSPSYHPLSQGIALEGMRLVKIFLYKAFNNGADLAARSHMMAAATMGATAFQKGLGAVHAISHPLGALYNVHHGVTNALLIPSVLRFNKPEIEEKILTVNRYLEIENGFEGFIKFVTELNKSLLIPPTLEKLGIHNLDTERVIFGALKDPSMSGNPIKMTSQEVREILLSCLK